MTKAAKETCGESEKRIENPWMIGKDEELQQMKSRIAGAVTERNRLAETARQNRQDLEEDFEQECKCFCNETRDKTLGKGLVE